MGDDFVIKLDDDFEGESLPLTPVGAMVGVGSNFRETFELNNKAEGLFDFSGSSLTPIQQMYIVAFATKGTKKGACEMAGVSYNVVKRWEDNQEFTAALGVAVETVQDTLEEELIARAMEGSDRLLLAAVKAAKPDRYNKKQQEVSVSGHMVHSWADLAKQAAEVDRQTKVIDMEEEDDG